MRPGDIRNAGLASRAGWAWGERGGGGGAARLAGALAELGLERGERLAAVLRNRHETVSLYWAAQWLGATFVPLSWRAAPARLAGPDRGQAARPGASRE